MLSTTRAPPRSPFGFAWALQHRPRALCWQAEDASDGLSSFPEPRGHASTQSSPRARRLEMPPGNSPGRAARRGSAAEAPACCTRGRERGAAASPAAATEQTGNLAGAAPLGHSWEKGKNAGVRCCFLLLTLWKLPGAVSQPLRSHGGGAGCAQVSAPGVRALLPTQTVLPRGWQVARPQPGTPSIEEGISRPQSPADKEGTVVLGAAAAPPPRHAGRQLVLEENGG